jgi:membrane-associated phospholipid phosphatase
LATYLTFQLHFRPREHGHTTVDVLRLIGVVLALCTALSAQTPSVDPNIPDAPSAVQTSLREGFQDPNSPDHNVLFAAGKRGLKDQAEIYRAPFRRAALPWDIGIAAVTTALIATDRRASGALSQTHKDVSLHISDAGLYGTMGSVGVFYITGLATGNAHAKETGVLAAETVANSMVVYAAIQYATGRERPLQGTGRGRFWQDNALDSSFPSGHSIATWAAASVIAREYPNKWVQVLAYGTAGAVSATRFSGLQHFPADVVIGSALGYFVGRQIFRSHCRAGLSGACSAKIQGRVLPRHRG